MAAIEEYGLVGDEYLNMSQELFDAEIVALQAAILKEIAETARKREAQQIKEKADLEKRIAKQKWDNETVKRFLVVYGESPQRIGPMSASNRDRLMREIKDDVRRGKLPPWDVQYKLYQAEVNRKLEARDAAARNKKKATVPKPPPKLPSPPSSDSDQKPISTAIKTKTRVVGKTKAKIVDRELVDELKKITKVRRCNFNPDIPSYFVERGKGVLNYYESINELLDLPECSLLEIYQKIFIYSWMEKLEMKLLKDTLGGLMNPNGSLNLPSGPMGGHDPITGWEFESTRRVYYLTRVTAGRVLYERDSLLALSRFDLATIAQLPLTNPTNSAEATELQLAIRDIYGDDIKAVREYWRFIASQEAAKVKQEQTSKTAAEGTSTGKRKKHMARRAGHKLSKKKKTAAASEQSTSEDPAAEAPRVVPHISSYDPILSWSLDPRTHMVTISRQVGGVSTMTFPQILNLPHVDLAHLSQIPIYSPLNESLGRMYESIVRTAAEHST